MRCERNPALLIHGIDDRGLLFDGLRAYLSGRGWAVHVLDLVPNDGAVGLDVLAEQIGAYARTHFVDGEPFDLVGFSMGGLVARYYVQRLARMGEVQRLVTVSTPHRGTWMGFLRGNRGARQMRPSSRFLRDLNGDAGALRGVRFTSLWTPWDLMIFPPWSSVMAEARSIRVHVAAHPLMLRSERVMQLVEAALIDEGTDSAAGYGLTSSGSDRKPRSPEPVA